MTAHVLLCLGSTLHPENLLITLDTISLYNMVSTYLDIQAYLYSNTVLLCQFTFWFWSYTSSEGYVWVLLGCLWNLPRNLCCIILLIFSPTLKMSIWWAVSDLSWWYIIWKIVNLSKIHIFKIWHFFVYSKVHENCLHSICSPDILLCFNNYIINEKKSSIWIPLSKSNLYFLQMY